MPTPSQASAFSRKLAAISSSQAQPITDLPYVKETPFSEEDISEEDIALPGDAEEDDDPVDSMDDIVASGKFLTIRLLEPEDEEKDPESEDSDNELNDFHLLTKHLDPEGSDPDLFHVSDPIQPEDDEDDLNLTEEDLRDVESPLLGSDIEDLNEDLNDDDDDDDEDEDDDDEDGDDEDLRMFDLLSAFLKLNNSPSDDQFHALAESLGIDHEKLEESVFRLISIMLEDEDIEEDTRRILSALIK
jgi:hypothetical protein